VDGRNETKRELMKAVLKFDLDNPDDRIDYDRCNKSRDMAIVLFDIRYNLFKRIENKLDKEIDDELMTAIMEEINEQYEAYELNRVIE
jgi:hypothetical protein